MNRHDIKQTRRTITIVYDRHFYTYKWLKVLYACKSEFKKLGYKIEYQGLPDFFPLNDTKKWNWERRSYKSACKGKHDIIFMAFHHSTSELCLMEPEKRLCILKKIKDHCKTLVWLDTADSTGTCMFDVMPVVDLYFKKQLLKNLDDYCRDVYGARTFCEFYHNLLGVEDEAITSRYYPHTEKKYLGKLRLAWNVGMGDLFARRRQIIFRPFRMTTPDFLNPHDNKPLDLQYRGSGYSPIAGYPRAESQRRIKELKEISCSDVTKKIPKDEYIKEGQSAKSILSPFGWGEVCGRDFEAIVYGSCMIKQDMGHCITYPDVYQPGVTYIPLKWDFSDFEDVIMKSNSEEYRNIADQAQNYYKKFFTKEGRIDFAKHIVKELEK